MLTTPQVGDRGGEASSTRGSLYQLLLGPTDTRVNSHKLSMNIVTRPYVLGSEKHHHSYVLRLFSDVLSAVFDGCHHPRCTGSDLGAHDTL